MKKLLFVLAATIALASLPVKSFSAKEAPTETIILTSSNTINLNSEVGGDSTAKIINQAKELDAKLSSGMTERITSKAPIYIFLSTPGGSVQSGLEMIEALKGLGRPIHTITLFAASMGFQIAQNLDTRYIIRNGVLMSHRAKGGFEGEFGGQAPSQIDSRYALWKSRMDELDQITANRTNGKQTLSTYQAAYASEMWRTGQQSVDQGYADKVVTVKCDPSLSGTTSHEAMVLGLFRVHYELDNCPINTSPTAVAAGFAVNKGGFMDETEFLSKGGTFGSDCLIQSANDKNKLCALDTTLNLQKLSETKEHFVQSYLAKMHQVVDRY